MDVENTEIIIYRGLDGAEYEQRPLVLRQYRQILALVKNMGDMKFDTATDSAFFNSIKNAIAEAGEKANDFLAIILQKKGGSVRDKNMAELADELDLNFDPELVQKAVEDFFVSRRNSAILENLKKSNLLSGPLRLISELTSSSSTEQSQSSLEDVPGGGTGLSAT